MRTEPDASQNLPAPSSARIDIDKEIINIREMYDVIDGHEIGGTFTKSKQTGDVTYNYIDSELAEVKVEPSSGDEYEEMYYYKDAELFFAYYSKENGDAYHFYFVDGVLIRIRYREDSSDYDRYANYDYYDNLDSDGYNDWQRSVYSDGMYYYNNQ